MRNAGTIQGMAFEVPRPDTAKLLNAWMQWERGESSAGRVMADMKTAGMRELLDGLVAAAAAEA